MESDEQDQGMDVEIIKNESVKFQKLWSEEDELTLLNGYYEYHQNNTNTVGGGFFDFIKPRLIRSSATRHQISDKISRLKKKFTAMPNSQSDRQADPHIQKLYELSTKIWGSNNVDHKDDSSNINNVVIGENEISKPKSQAVPLPAPAPAEEAELYDVSKVSILGEFSDFLLDEGVDIALLDDQRVESLKKKFVEMEIAKSTLEYNQIKLNRKIEKLKYQYFQRVHTTLFSDS